MLYRVYLYFPYLDHIKLTGEINEVRDESSLTIVTNIETRNTLRRLSSASVTDCGIKDIYSEIKSESR